MCIFCTSVHYREYTFLLLLGIATEMLVAFLQLQLQGRTWTRSCFLSHTICYVIHCSVTVAASDIRDRFAGFSNWGRCVDIIAPVTRIFSQVDACVLLQPSWHQHSGRDWTWTYTRITITLLMNNGFHAGCGCHYFLVAMIASRTISGTAIAWSRPLTWNVQYVISV